MGSNLGKFGARLTQGERYVKMKVVIQAMLRQAKEYQRVPENQVQDLMIQRGVGKRHEIDSPSQLQRQPTPPTL